MYPRFGYDSEEPDDSDCYGTTPTRLKLKADLKEAIQDSFFDFCGTFAHGYVLVSAHNPDLQIHCLGAKTIGFPVSVSNMAAIKEAANVVTKNHWKIDASNISFKNPKWLEQMTSTLESTFYELDANFEASPELCKLLVLGPGARLEVVENTPDSSATAVIDFPSLYMGGKLEISHKSSKKIFDFSTSSEFDTTTMA